MGLLKISCLLLATQLVVQTATTTTSGLQDGTATLVEAVLSEDSHAAAFQKNVTSLLAEKQKPERQQSASGILFADISNKHKLRTCNKSHQPTSMSSAILRSFIRTNNMRAYHLDLHTYQPEAKFIGDPAFVDSSSEAHQQRCSRHLKHYESLVETYQRTDPMEMSLDSLEPMKLVDTLGRPDAGLLYGHQFWLGSYENCLDLSITLASHESSGQRPGLESTVNSQYCLGLAQFPSWKAQDTKSSFKIGLCLPETCTSSMLNEQADLFQTVERIMKSQLGGPNQPLDKLKLRSVYCLPHPTSKARQLQLSGKLLIAVLAALLIACLYATLHDYLNRKTSALAASAQVASSARVLAAHQEQHQMQLANGDQESKGEVEVPRTWRIVLVESFSLMRNFEKIVDLSERRSSEPVVVGEVADEFRFNKNVFFSSITGIKCVGLLWIMAAHCFLVGPIPHKNLIVMDQLTQTYLANIYLAAHLMVDSFFALSGLLAAYLLFKHQAVSKMTPGTWLALTVHRYWRLTPVYLLCFWFAKTLAQQLSSGPLWDYGTAAQSPRLNCANESWLMALLHMSDFKSPKAHCVPFAWFIANGIKFWMMTPIFLAAIYRSLRVGYALLLATILANVAVVVSLAINSNVDMKSVIEFKPESADNMLNNMEEVYTRPYSRIGAYLVGLMAGHMIYLVDSQRLPMRMSEKMKILIWSLFSVTTIVLTFVVKIANGVELHDAAIPWVFSFCSALIRPLWALCTCWLVFALAHGQARWLSRILSASVWRILARLSFCAYLVQGEVIAHLYFSATHSSPYTYEEMVTRPIVAAAVIVTISLIVALVVEYPLVGIEELLLPRRADKSKRQAANGSKQQTSKDPIKMPNGVSSQTLHSATIQTLTMNGTMPNGEKLKEL